jgi:hypothetical protein
VRPLFWRQPMSSGEPRTPLRTNIRAQGQRSYRNFLEQVWSTFNSTLSGSPAALIVGQLYEFVMCTIAHDKQRNSWASRTFHLISQNPR